MTEKLYKDRHGNLNTFLINLTLLGLLGAVLIRVITAGVYIVLPTTYFLDYGEPPILVSDLEWCGVQNEQVVDAIATRYVYQYLPEAIAKNKAVKANTTIEIFKTDGTKIDDIRREPVIEWREDGINPVEWNFDTVILPGQYYIEITSFIELPIIGQREDPIRTRSNVFNVYKCGTLQTKI